MEVVSLQDRKHFVHEAWFQHHYGGIASFFEGMTIENILVPDYQNRIYFDAPSDPEAQIGKVRGRFRHSPVFVLDGRQYSLGTTPHLSGRREKMPPISIRCLLPPTRCEILTISLLKTGTTISSAAPTPAFDGSQKCLGRTSG